MQNYNQEEIGQIIKHQKQAIDMIYNAMFSKPKEKKTVKGYGGGWASRHAPELLEKYTEGYNPDEDQPYYGEEYGK